jgi:hypothetical protein
VWFISLGDLLTLLVCFFLVLTPQNLSPQSKSHSKQAVSTPSDRLKVVGTMLAPGPIGQSVGSSLNVPVWIDTAEFSERQNPDQFSKGVDWKGMVKQALSTQAAVVVKLCDASLERAFFEAVVRELGEDRKSASLLSFEVGADCKRWSAKEDETRRLVAVLDFAKS